jgi:hypothetical protein
MKKHTKLALEILDIAFPRWSDRVCSSPERVEIWGELLEDVDPENLLEAVRQLAKSNKWAPSIAEIREAAGCEVVARRSGPINEEDL